MDYRELAGNAMHELHVFFDSQDAYVRKSAPHHSQTLRI